MLKRRLHRLVRVYTCQNTTLLEITCLGSFVYNDSHLSLNQQYIIKLLEAMSRLACMVHLTVLRHTYIPVNIESNEYSKTCLKRSHSKIDKTKVLKTNGSLLKVESIAACSKRAFCNALTCIK